MPDDERDTLLSNNQAAPPSNMSRRSPPPSTSSATLNGGRASVRGDATGKRKRVLVVGAGAAGMACTEQLAQHPDRFDVTLVEAQGYCGGQAFSIPIDEKKHGAPWMNQGVQGGSYIYHHTFRAFKQQGYDAKPVELQVSFGRDDTFWSNVFPSHLLEKHAKEIKRFERAMKVMRWTEAFWAVIPIKVSLKMWFFSDE